MSDCRFGVSQVNYPDPENKIADLNTDDLHVAPKITILKTVIPYIYFKMVLSNHQQTIEKYIITMY